MCVCLISWTLESPVSLLRQVALTGWELGAGREDSSQSDSVRHLVGPRLLGLQLYSIKQGCESAEKNGRAHGGGAGAGGAPCVPRQSRRPEYFRASVHTSVFSVLTTNFC